MSFYKAADRWAEVIQQKGDRKKPQGPRDQGAEHKGNQGHSGPARHDRDDFEREGRHPGNQHGPGPIGIEFIIKGGHAARLAQ